MSDYGIVYTTRERVISGIDIGLSTEARFRVDEAIEAGSRAVEGMLKRRFYPEVRTHKLDWPSRSFGRSWRVWLGTWNEVISVSELLSGGVEISSDNYILYPNSGPPYNRIEINIGLSGAFQSGSSHQNSIELSGLFGWSDNQSSCGQTASSIDADDVTLDISNSARVGIGTILKIESERVVVEDKSWLTSGQTLQTPLTATPASRTVAVSSGAGFNTGEYILLDSEIMVIDQVSGNNLTVRRAVQGSVIATHTGSTIYVPRRLTIRRGVLGSTASTHSSTTSLTRWVPERLIESLTVAEATAIFLAENSGYARTVGSGDSEREVRGTSLKDLREQAMGQYGRHMTHRAV